MSDKKRMGRLKKFLLVTGVGFVAFIALAVGTVYFGSQSKINAQVEQDVKPVTVPEGDDDAIARGKYLVDHVMGCSHSDCHRADLGGGTVIDAPPMGMIYAPNLTQGQGSVTKDFEAVDFVRVVRHGIKKDGRRAIMMPSEDYWNFPDSDIGAVIAYVKSMPAVDRETREHEPGFLARALLVAGEIKFAHEKIHHDSPRPQAERGPTKEWGAVLIGTCMGCHGETLSGGKIPGGDPNWPEARNITQDETAGIGKWDYETFTNAFRHGKRPDGTDLNPLMPWQAYKGMEEDDVRALWEYLQGVPAKATGGR